MKIFKNHSTTLFLVGLLFSWVGPHAVWGHVTPVVKLHTLKETLSHLLPDKKLHLKEVNLNDGQVERLKSFGNWDSVGTNHKFFLSQGDDRSLDRAVVFMTEFTRHGSLVVAVSLNPDGKVLEAMITHIQLEVLEWVSPLLKRSYMDGFRGKDSGLQLVLNPQWKEETSKMTQAYALVIANAVKRSAQLFDIVFK